MAEDITVDTTAQLKMYQGVSIPAAAVISSAGVDTRNENTNDTSRNRKLYVLVYNQYSSTQVFWCMIPYSGRPQLRNKKCPGSKSNLGYPHE